MKNLFVALITLTALHVSGQVEELNQRTELFVSELEGRFKVKSINGREPDYGYYRKLNSCNTNITNSSNWRKR